MSDKKRLAELKADDGGITRDDFLFLLALYEKAEAENATLGRHNARLLAEVATYKAENARLRAALKDIVGFLGFVECGKESMTFTAYERARAALTGAKRKPSDGLMEPMPPGAGLGAPDER